MTHSEYPSFRKLFHQWMFMERLVLLSDAEFFFKKLIAGSEFNDDLDNEKDFNVFIDFCKKSLNKIYLDLKKQLFVIDGKKIEYIGLYNTKTDKISQTATKMNAENLEYFKELIDMSKRSKNHEFKYLEIEQCLKISKAQIQNLLKELVENDWLFFNHTLGNYCLGPRTLLELSDYLNDYNGEKGTGFYVCFLCSSLIVCGESIQCLTDSCDTRYHQLCINEYFKFIEKTDCPKCRNPLN